MNKKIKVIIIDDEKLAREIIKSYLKKFDNIDLVAECSDGFEGIKQINVNCQLIKNIVVKVTTMVKKSAMMGINPSEKISLMLSISLMVLVVNVPMGVLSN